MICCINSLPPIAAYKYVAIAAYKYVAIAAYKYVANPFPFKNDVDMLILWNVYVKEWFLESFGFGLCPLLWFELS